MKSIIKSICKSALHGELELDKFYELWPVEADKNEFFKIIYEDIEDGVMHVPSSFFSGKLLLKEWYRSSMYHILYLDYILLGLDKDTNELRLCRESIIKKEKLSEDIIKKEVGDYFAH